MKRGVGGLHQTVDLAEGEEEKGEWEEEEKEQGQVEGVEEEEPEGRESVKRCIS